MNNIEPKIPFLQQGDTIAVIASAYNFAESDLQRGVEYVSAQGFNITYGKYLFEKSGQFAGDDTMRAYDLQKALSNKKVKAIIFARGGYGTARILDKIKFNTFKKNPKWICGYSDITALHSHLNLKLQIPSIHSPMIINPESLLEQRLQPLIKMLKGENDSISFTSKSTINRSGTVEGKIIGGNLSVLISIMNSASDADWKDKILLLEDVGEQFYNIDRMMLCLHRAGKLKKLKGLIVGDFNEMKDGKIPFGMDVEQIIHQYVQQYDYPIFYGARIGHDDINIPIKLGANSLLKFAPDKLSINFY